VQVNETIEKFWTSLTNISSFTSTCLSSVSGMFDCWRTSNSTDYRDKFDQIDFQAEYIIKQTSDSIVDLWNLPKNFLAAKYSFAFDLFHLNNEKF